jgi:LemA protein
MSTWIIILIVLVLLLVIIYNGFVRIRTRASEAWADIDVQLKRRYDLIPNLIETVKGYATHEREVLESVTQARNMAFGAGAIDNLAGREQAENQLTGALKSLFAVAENYPDLKANTNFLELQRELSDTENKIQAARRFYNSVVTELNIKIDSFPSGAIGRMFGFKKREFFGLDNAPAEREVVKVNFNS